MKCSEFEQFSEQWMEGARPPEAAAHARECPRCRNLIEDLEAIRAAAPLLADDAAPPPRLWTAIRAQLESEGLLRTRRSWGEQLADFFGPALRPALVGAALVLLAATVILVNFPRRTAPQQAEWSASNERAFGSLATQLDGVEQLAVPALHENNPAVQASLQMNLAIVDNSIAVCEKAVREQPQDEMTRDYLYDAYQQKAELLATIAERGSAIQ